MKNLLIAIPALLLTLTLSAQHPMHGRPGGPGKPGYGMHQGRQHEPFASLNLSPAQKETLQKEQEKFRQEMQALNKNENITVKAQRDKREALLKAHKANMEKVLTPDQQKQLAEQRSKRQQQMQLKATQRIDQMKIKLNLTEAQVSTLKANAQKRHSQMQALMQNENMDRVARREAMEKMHADAKAEMQKVLSPEQYKQWQDMRPEGRKQGQGRGHGPKFGREA